MTLVAPGPPPSGRCAICGALLTTGLHSCAAAPASNFRDSTGFKVVTRCQSCGIVWDDLTKPCPLCNALWVIKQLRSEMQAAAGAVAARPMAPLDAVQVRGVLAEVFQRIACAVARIEVTTALVEAVHILHERRGKIVTTGMGKAGIVARKVAGTLCSTAAPAVYVSPSEAAHGDAGVVAAGDVLLAFSTSGATREVLEFIGQARGLGVAWVVGITSHVASPLRALCDVVVDMGLVEEPYAWGCVAVPTASTHVMLAIGDALALALMQANEVTLETFGRRHHGGYLGRMAR